MLKAPEKELRSPLEFLLRMRKVTIPGLASPSGEKLVRNGSPPMPFFQPLISMDTES